jgi:hypothetical protein
MLVSLTDMKVDANDLLRFEKIRSIPVPSKPHQKNQKIRDPNRPAKLTKLRSPYKDSLYYAGQAHCKS